jgi:hypothetical protein
MNQKYIKSVINSQEFQTLLNTPTFPRKNSRYYCEPGKLTSSERQLEDGTLEITYMEHKTDDETKTQYKIYCKYVIYSNGYIRIGRDETENEIHFAPRRIPEDVSNFMTIYPTAIQLLTNISLGIKNKKDTGALDVNSLFQYLDKIYGSNREIISGILSNKLSGKHEWVIKLLKAKKFI